MKQKAKGKTRFTLHTDSCAQNFVPIGLAACTSQHAERFRAPAAHAHVGVRRDVLAAAKIVQIDGLMTAIGIPRASGKNNDACIVSLATGVHARAGEMPSRQRNTGATARRCKQHASIAQQRTSVCVHNKQRSVH
jgi:hypothetical protein